MVQHHRLRFGKIDYYMYNTMRHRTAMFEYVENLSVNTWHLNIDMYMNMYTYFSEHYKHINTNSILLHVFIIHIQEHSCTRTYTSTILKAVRKFPRKKLTILYIYWAGAPPQLSSFGNKQCILLTQEIAGMID